MLKNFRFLRWQRLYCANSCRFVVNELKNSSDSGNTFQVVALLVQGDGGVGLGAGVGLLPGVGLTLKMVPWL
jgi:hypothetical protein